MISDDHFLHLQTSHHYRYCCGKKHNRKVLGIKIICEIVESGIQVKRDLYLFTSMSPSSIFVVRTLEDKLPKVQNSKST